MLHFFSHVLVQKPSPKSKPCTLPEICLTYDIPLLMKGRWPRPRNRLKRFQTVKQGGTNKNTHFHTIAHPNWLEVWSCDISCFSFLDASPDFLLKSNHCVSFPLAGFYLNRSQKPLRWSLQGWCQDILWKQHATMFPKSVGPLPGRSV